MSTSLAQQLKRLQAPQTALLTDSLTRASLLFDPKEAAEKDRETIFEIGLSGLEELIVLNPAFSEFENSLFDPTAKDFQRAVESSEVNIRLNKTIGKFLNHLSPYFLIQPAHKCLEWMIRRYQIHTFNRDDFVALILPYHETRIFVRCLQLLVITDESDRWFWLKKIQRQGVPLSKRTIFNHAAARPSFLKFIGQTVTTAIRTLKNRGNTLQTLFSFYCTTTIGTLFNLPELQENHVINILPALLKGLKSEFVDFTAAAYMVTAQLLVKGTTSFNTKFLNSILQKLLVCQHTNLQMDSVMLIILMFNYHREIMNNGISIETMSLIVENPRIITLLGNVANENCDVVPFYMEIVRGCLRMAQKSGDNSSIGWKDARKLLLNAMNEIRLRDSDAEQIIQVVIESYVDFESKFKQTKKVAVTDSVIEIESDNDDDVQMVDQDQLNDTKMWYSDYLKRFEVQNSTAFDSITKRIMKGEVNNLSAEQKSALKGVLGTLLQITYTDDNTNIFENLYHNNWMQRARAVKYIADNFSKLNINSDNGDLFRESLVERINDDNPDVVVEVLRMPTKNLINIFGGSEQVIKHIYTLILRSVGNMNKYEPILDEILTKLNDSNLFTAEIDDDLFVYAFPLCFPLNGRDVRLMRKLLSTDFGKRNKFIKCLEEQIAKNKALEADEVLKITYEVLETQKKSSSDFERVVKNVRHIFKHNITAQTFFYCTTLLTHEIGTSGRKLNGEQLMSLLDLVVNSLTRVVCTFDDSDNIESHQNLDKRIIPTKLITNFLWSIISVIDVTKIRPNVNLSVGDGRSETVDIIIKLLEFIIQQFFGAHKSNDKITYRRMLTDFLNKIFPSADDNFEFLCNVFTVAAPEYQMRILRLLVASVRTTPCTVKSVRFNSICHILFGLNSRYAAIRKQTIELIDSIDRAKIGTPFLKRIIEQREEISCDHEQLPLILFSMLSSKRHSYEDFLNKITNKIIDEATSEQTAAKLLELVKHINSTEILKHLSRFGERLLNKTMPKDDAHTTLNIDQSDIMRNIIYRYDTSTMGALSDDHVLKFACQLLRNHKTFIRCEKKLKTPATVLLETLTAEYIEKIATSQQIILIRELIEAATNSDDDHLLAAAKKLFIRIEIDSTLVEDILKQMRDVVRSLSEDTTLLAKNKNKRGSLRLKENFSTPVGVLLTSEWRVGTTLLEFLQNKQNLINSFQLIPTYFEILKICLNFEEQSTVEYTKQLLLSCILSASEHQPLMTKKGRFQPEKVFCIEDIVQCIRGTQNPQTHHHALLLLCHTASSIPEQVLHHMMNIFTFMGSSVVRHDDAYSFQIIIKIIETVIPILIHSNDDKLAPKERENLTIPVLKIFSDIVLDVPEHRRVPLYTKLLCTLGAENYLWMFIGVLFESHVVRQEKEKKTSDSTTDRKSRHEHLMDRRIDIALTITQEFDVRVIIETCTSLLEYIRTLPVEIQEKSSNKNVMEIDVTDAVIFHLNSHTSKQFRHFKYTILQFISTLTASPAFVNRIAVLTESELADMRSFYQNFIIKILMYIPETSKAAERCKENQKQYWKVMLYHCYDILDNAVSLLSTQTFLLVVHGLVQHKILSVRKRVIELFVTKLQHNTEFVEKCDTEQLLAILGQLRKIVEMPVRDEIAEIQQVSLIAIKLLSKFMCPTYFEHFKEILVELTEFLSSPDTNSQSNKNLRGTVVLCLGEVCVNLKAHSLSHLSKFMPVLIDILGGQIMTPVNNPLLIATITSLQKIIEAIPLFLSPYIIKLITILAETSSTLSASDDKLANRLNQTFEKISSSIPGRILIPAIETVHKKLNDQRKYRALTPVMKIISESFDHIPAEEVRTLQSELSNFFMSALEIRSLSTDNLQLAEVTQIETDVINAFVRLVLKLSESSFRPLYMKLYDWAIRNNDEYDGQNDKGKLRAITFYNLSMHIAEALKSMITLFAGTFIQNASEMLNECNPSKVDELFYGDSKENNVLLVEYIIRTLYLVFLNDSQNFVNAQRFEILMQPIVDQIENELIIERDESINLVSMCIAQLAVAINDDSLWKQLNYQVLLKTRTNNHKIRLFALKVCLEIAQKLGVNYVPFLPETIPFLAELMEDENPEVERFCHKTVQDIEKIVGESLQKYF